MTLEFVIYKVGVGKDGRIYLTLECEGSDSYPTFAFAYSDELLLKLSKLTGSKAVIFEKQK